MRYYCNVCQRDITKAEFLYSIDKFDRPLCREHQALERGKNKAHFEQSIEAKNDVETKPVQQVKEQDIAEESEINEENPQKKGWKSLVKKIAVTTGKGIVKGAKYISDSTKKTMQIRRFKEQILRRMNKGQLRQLCKEKKIATLTTRSSLEVDHRDDKLYFKDQKHIYTYDELISRLKSRVSLNEIISYAKRRNVRIRDIMLEIDKWKAQQDIKKLKEQGEEIGEDLIEILDAIESFTPFRRYSNELEYQIDLARHLKTKFSKTDIEEKRSSTRPDIVVRDIAIEIKGPTFHHDLKTVSDKCMRYLQYYPKGMIVVLFDVSVAQRLYDDWYNGMKNHYPDVEVIVK